MQAHVDPQTGDLIPEPATPAPSELPLPPEAPVAEVPAPGGGTMVELQGRFLSNLVATINPDGSVRLDCLPAP